MLSAVTALAAAGVNVVQVANTKIQGRLAHVLDLDDGQVTPTFGYLRGPGWSAAHVKRMARKKRNKARHKAAVRR